jgi:hypothetical protein
MSKTSANTVKKSMLLDQLSVGAQMVPVMGYFCWWNVKNVCLTKEQFEKKLEAAGLDKKYARLHNYRSAFIRALRDMEENRIIRKVDEDEYRLVYQFTAESIVGAPGGEKSLDYEKETIIVIDKDEYRKEGDFKKAIIKGKPAIITAIVKLFDEHKQKYKSSDITRYLQRILRDEADIISLRPQGSIYFVPVGYLDALNKVAALVEGIGSGSKLERAPLVAADDSKAMVKNALLGEVDETFKQIEKDLEAVTKEDKEVTKVWSATRIGKIKKLLDRLESYKEGGVIDDTKAWQDNFAAAEKKILGVRHVKLDDDEVKKEKEDVKEGAA